MSTKEAEYALMQPFNFYKTLWQRTVISYRPWDSDPFYHDVDLAAGMPAWWPISRKDEWKAFLATIYPCPPHQGHCATISISPIQDLTCPLCDIMDHTRPAPLIIQTSLLDRGEGEQPRQADELQSADQKILSRCSLVAETKSLKLQEIHTKAKFGAGDIATVTESIREMWEADRVGKRPRKVALEGSFGLNLLADAATAQRLPCDAPSP